MIFATSSLDGGDYREVIKAWRKTMIGRGRPLRARDFDNAVNGANKAMAGHPETVASLLIRSSWYSRNGMPVVFVRPSGWSYGPEELEAIRIIRVRTEPKFISYDQSGIDEVQGPATKANKWDRWR